MVFLWDLKSGARNYTTTIRHHVEEAAAAGECYQFLTIPPKFGIMACKQPCRTLRLVVYVAFISLGYYGCEKKQATASGSVPITCYTDFDDITVTLYDHELSSETNLTLDEQGNVVFSELLDHEYTLSVKAFESGFSLPTSDFTKHFHGTALFSWGAIELPSPSQPSELTIHAKDENIVGLWRPAQIPCNEQGSIEFFMSDNPNLLYTSDFKAAPEVVADGGAFIFPIGDTVKYVGVKHTYWTEEVSFTTYSRPRELDPRQSEFIYLVLGEETVFNIPDGGSRFFRLPLEEGKFYSVDLRDANNSEQTGREMVLSSSGYFSEVRASNKRGCAYHFRATQTGYVTMNAQIAYGGQQGTFAVTLNEISTANPVAWDTSHHFTKNHTVMVAHREFSAGTHLIKSHLEDYHSGMFIYFSLYTEDGYDPIHPESFYSPFIGPTNDSDTISRSVTLTLNKPEKVWVVISSAYAGAANTLHFSFE